jgi:hypothetical protein
MPKDPPARDPNDPMKNRPVDAQGRPMHEEIDLNEAEEAALDAVWDRRAAELQAEKAGKKDQKPA